MRLDEMMAAIRNSEPRDWAQFESPTYLEECSNRFAYLQDLSIGLAWGATLNENYHGAETWVENFPDSSASSHTLDFLFNGMLVHRDSGVYVDGYRCVLPIPRMEKGPDGNYRWWVAESDLEFWQLFNAILNSTTDFAHYVRLAGFEIR